MKISIISQIMLSWLVLTTPAVAQDLSVQTNFANEQWIEPDKTITLQLSRVVPPSEGKIAVFIGAADFTDLFIHSSQTMDYSPAILPLPAGETTLTIYLVSPQNEWREIGRFPLKILTRAGFKKASVEPKLNVNNQGQVAEGHFPDSNRPLRSTYQDLSGQINLTTDHAKGNFNAQSQWLVVGVSNQNEAIRFSERGQAAPKTDLASYLAQMQKGVVQLSLGHIQHGRHRFLINNYGSRGPMLKAEWGSRFDISAAAMNGTSIAGWNNFAGLNDAQHRILSGALGLEFIKNRPGALRMEAAFMDGSLLPRNHFNQANINDAEKSRGAGFRFAASDNSQRLRFEGGFARSRFDNPNDALLAQGEALVPVRATTRDARYVDMEVGILKNAALSQTWQANLSVAVRHQRVDPLYRSLGTYVQADYLENVVEVQGQVGVIAASYSHGRSEDNLARIPSVLKTKTRRHAANLALPLAAIFSKSGGQSKWLPALAYGFDQTHQLGASLPPNSGFSPSHVPDQMSNSHFANFNWHGARLSFGYNLGYRTQDNRQPGRERADFTHLINAFSLGLAPIAKLNLNFSLGLERAESKESKRIDKTKRFGAGFNLHLPMNAVLNGDFSATGAEDKAKTNESSNNNLSLQGSI
ncbi:MAG: hypothetical protein ACREOI_26850, partial [bacterium]